VNQLVVGVYNNFNDYLELAKPRIGLLVLFTAAAGLSIAQPGWPAASTIIATLVGTALASAASGLFNNYLDRDIDPLMSRTRHRALASGRVDAVGVLLIATLSVVFSTLILLAFVDSLAAVFTVFTVFFYTAVYTLWLKRRSYWCTEIGGVAGAMPPLIGYAAVTGSVNLQASLLFLLMFLWQPPHFLVLALMRVGEYRDAGIPMLPVVKGVQATKLRMLIYTVLLLPVSIVLCVSFNASPLSYAVITIINSVYIGKTVIFFKQDATRKQSLSLFGFSIFYMFAMFGMVFLMA
jgi:protoheme IX farnesyltransferase